MIRAATALGGAVLLTLPTAEAAAQEGAAQHEAADASIASDETIVRTYIDLLERGRWQGRTTNDSAIFDIALAEHANVAVAEQRIENWPDDMPPRDQVRALLRILSIMLTMNRASQENRAIDVNLFGNMFSIVDSASKITSSQLRRSRQFADMVGLAVIAQNWPNFGTVINLARVPRDDVRRLQRNFLNYVDGLGSTQPIWIGGDRAAFLYLAAKIQFAPSGVASDYGDAEAGQRLLRLARQLALENEDYSFAALATQSAVEQSLRLDPSGRDAAAMLGSLDDTNPGRWRDRRGMLAARMLVSGTVGDVDELAILSERWFAVLRADLSISNEPFWSAHVPSDDQLEFLSSPIRAAEMPRALQRLDALANITRAVGSGTGRALAERHTADESDDPQPVTVYADTGSGSDAVIIASPRGLSLAQLADPEVITRALNGVASNAAPIFWAAHRPAERDTGDAVAQSRLEISVLLAELSRSAAGSLPAYFQAFFGQHVPPEASSFFQPLFEPLRASTEPQFWSAFGEPIDALMGGRCAAEAPLQGRTPTILLIVPASLSLFPVELARAPNGRRLIDCYEFRRAPSPNIAARSSSRWRGRALRGNIAGVFNPDNNLLFSGSESALFDAASRRALGTLDTTNAATILNQATNTDILHLSAHGRLGFLDPFDSEITIAPGQGLTFRQIVSNQQPTKALLVVLSACEAGLSSPLSGEIAYWGMASAFLEAGAGGVVGALWRVRDDAAALTMGKFYELLLRRHRPPAAALREAQLWLRDASEQELHNFVDGAMLQADAAGQTQLASLHAQIHSTAQASSGAPPYADPMLWGGFGYFGSYRDTDIRFR